MIRVHISLSSGGYIGGSKCFRGGPNFTSSGGPYFFTKLVPGGTNFGGSIFAMTDA